ncbi:MAG: alpha/beta fold hydrolase [Gammaproteobacteria bacterium]|nr:alpha/beta fold hydrolase [Gammaproteobacteria bacterium]
MQQITQQIAVHNAIPLGQAQSIMVDIFLPPVEKLQPTVKVFCCLPGGGLSRGYYHLQTEDNLSHSFAHAMTAAGHIVITQDHLGTDNTSAEFGFELGLTDFVAANQAAMQHVLNQLTSGTLLPELPALPHLSSIGVGHSMGAMLMIIQQAEYQTHHALVVLGFCNGGLPKMLNEAERLYANNSQAAKTHAQKLAEARFGKAFLMLPEAQQPATNSASVATDIIAVMQTMKTKLATVPGLLGMIPGSVATDTALIQVPVYIAVGDRDIAQPAEAIPAAFTGSVSTKLEVLADTGHNHFIYLSRHLLFSGIKNWLNSLSNVWNTAS